MFISPLEIARLERTMGPTTEFSVRFAMKGEEMDLVEYSMRDGRAHDVTVFPFYKGRVVTIEKHGYPPVISRAPSGGVKRGESIIEGAKREAHEETGLEVELGWYITRFNVDFTCGTKRVQWTSHVFIGEVKGEVVESELAPLDTVEIRKVNLVDIDELLGPIAEKMMASDVGGFHYRVELTEKTLELWKKRLE